MDCPICADDYTNLGLHWQQSECGYPSLSTEQREIVMGLLMGDGTMDRGGRHPRLTVEMTNQAFLEWVDGRLDWLSTGVAEHLTAEEKVEKAKDDPHINVINEDNYNDTYRLRTRSHKELGEFAEWYDSGHKTFPDDLTLTPMVTKMWYVCDGSLCLSQTSVNPSIYIYSTNESEEGNKIEQYFEGVGFEAKVSGESIYFGVDDTAEMLEWMGEVPSGFEYKWTV